MNTRTIILSCIVGVLILYLLVFADVVSNPSSSSSASEYQPHNPTLNTNTYTNNNNNANVNPPPQQPCPANNSATMPVRVPRIDHIVRLPKDLDTTADWNDDDGHLRYITLFYQPTIDHLQALRRFVGSVHFYENEKSWVTVFGYDVKEDFYEEVRTFSFVRYIQLDPVEAGTNEQSVSEFVKKSSTRLYSKYIYAPISEAVQLKAKGLSQFIQEQTATGPIKITMKDKNLVGHIYGDGTGIELDGDTYFTAEPNVDYGPCALLRNITSPFRSKFIYARDNDHFIKKEERHHPDDRLVCLAIATYSGSHPPASVDEFSLMKHVLPSFLRSTIDIDRPETRYRFAMYLGLQRDPFYDDKAHMDEITRKIEEATQDRAFSFRVFYTPLNAPALDITFKWNALIDQSYRDGCEYIYQYSDDTIFETPWADEFIRYLEAESNFGIVGATDTNNPNIMTLSFSHRNHISILGSYWPTHLKNWWSDNWAQTVYGKRYTLHSRTVQMRNTQQQGQRYPACYGHGDLYNKLMSEESRPRILAWLKTQPQTYDIREKTKYFEGNQFANDKK